MPADKDFYIMLQNQMKIDQKLNDSLSDLYREPFEKINIGIKKLLNERKKINGKLETISASQVSPLFDQFKIETYNGAEKILQTWYEDQKNNTFKSLDDNAMRFVEVVYEASLNNYLNWWLRYFLSYANREARGKPFYYESWGAYHAGQRSIDNKSASRAVSARTAEQSKIKMAKKSKHEFVLKELNESLSEQIENVIQEELAQGQTKIIKALEKNKRYSQLTSSEIYKKSFRLMPYKRKNKGSKYYSAVPRVATDYEGVDLVFYEDDFK